MAKQKNKPVNASTARVRVAPKRPTKVKRATKPPVQRKRAIGKQPPQKLFDAKKWLGVLPELAGDTLSIQRKMRDEW